MKSNRRVPVGVILAAGEGARLGVGSKPLARVGGVTLLERSIVTLRRAGVDRIVVVAGHAKDELRRFVGRKGLDVEVVDNDRFSVGNGSSVLVGGRAAGGRFVLVMADHVFDPDELAPVLASDAPFVFAVDSAPAYADPDEATKVLLDGDRVVAVGKGLNRWDAVDAGLFVCDASVLRATERCVAEGEGTWNDVKRRLLAEGSELVAVDLRGAFWLDVDTPQERAHAERLLVDRAAGKVWDGAVSRWLNRPVSRPLSRGLIRTGISPNGVTLLAFALARRRDGGARCGGALATRHGRRRPARPALVRRGRRRRRDRSRVAPRVIGRRVPRHRARPRRRRGDRRRPGRRGRRRPSRAGDRRRCALRLAVRPVRQGRLPPLLRSGRCPRRVRAWARAAICACCSLRSRPSCCSRWRVSSRSPSPRTSRPHDGSIVGWRSAHSAQPRATPAALALARVEPPSRDVMPLPAARAVSARSVDPRR